MLAAGGEDLAGALREVIAIDDRRGANWSGLRRGRHLIRGERTQRRQRAGLHRLLQLDALRLRIGQGPGLRTRSLNCAAAHAEGLLEQALRQRAGLQIIDRHGAGGLPDQHDVVRIAAELRDIAIDPFQRGHLIEETPIAGSIVP